MLFARRRATNTSFYLNNEEFVNFDNINDNNNLEVVNNNVRGYK